MYCLLGHRLINNHAALIRRSTNRTHKVIIGYTEIRHSLGAHVGKVCVRRIDGCGQVTRSLAPGGSVVAVDVLLSISYERALSHYTRQPLFLQSRAVLQSLRARIAEYGVNGLEVHRGKRANVHAHLLEGGRIQTLGLRGDWRLYAHDDVPRHGGVVHGQQAPVEEAALAQVRVVALLRGPLEHLGHELRTLGRALEKQLHGRGQQRELHLVRLLVEGEQEVVEQDLGILDALRVLPDDPDHGGLGLGLVKRVEVLAQPADDALVPVRVLAEDVADHNGGLLDDVGDLGGDEVEEDVDAGLCGLFELDGELADGADGLADEVDVDLGRVPVAE